VTETVTVVNVTRGTTLAETVTVAASFWSRFRGLMFRPSLDETEGLLLRPCNSIHMFFMRFAIDVVFLDDDERVVAVLPAIRPWRVSTIYWSATHALEIPAGTAARTGTVVGDQLAVQGAPRGA